MRFLFPLIRFVFHLGYLGPLVMGILDSSFLILPFGNDLMVVGLVADNRQGAAWYILSAACGSTLGVLLLALVSRKLGEAGLRKVAGDARYDKLKDRIGNRGGLAVTVGALAPPPFPFTTVIAALSAIDYPIWRMLVFNFSARAVRFAILAVLALKFGKTILQIAKSPPFEWGMTAFIVLCVAASGLSIWQWLRIPRAERR